MGFNIAERAWLYKQIKTSLRRHGGAQVTAQAVMER